MPSFAAKTRRAQPLGINAWSVAANIVEPAVRRLASSCRQDIMERGFPNWLRFVIFLRASPSQRAMGVSLATTYEPRLQHQFLPCATKQTRHRSDALRGDGRGRVAL